MQEILDDTVAGWQRERPDLDLRAMFTMLRMVSVMNAATRAFEVMLAEHGIGPGEFDVLATLRRHGRGAQLAPGFLARVGMISPGGMTSRLDRLEAAGHVARRPDPRDRRASLVSLTRTGRAVVDRALEDLVAAESGLLGALSDADRDRLDRSLDALIARLDGRDGSAAA